jgi:cell pole-organizing protein PopZ
MGDISSEPSMEDILSSIKRIIAEEGETATAGGRARRVARTFSPRLEPGSFGHDEILELSDPVRVSDEEAPVAVDEPVAAESPTPFLRPGSRPVESILRQRVPPPATGLTPLPTVTDPAPADADSAPSQMDAEPAPEPIAADPAPEPVAAEPVVAAPAAAPAQPTPAADPILSSRAADASRGSLDALSRLVVKPEVTGSDTLEGMVREMLRPMLREWLDAHLPAMVETMVAREIARITGSR